MHGGKNSLIEVLLTIEEDAKKMDHKSTFLVYLATLSSYS